MHSLLSLTDFQPFLCTDEFFSHTDEKPAGVENTFLLCPAPVVDEIGKYVAVFLLKNEHLALW